MPEDYRRTDIRQLRKDLDEAIRLALEGHSGIGQMRAAADAEKVAWMLPRATSRTRTNWA
jgi:hypothetical protein